MICNRLRFPGIAALCVAALLGSPSVVTSQSLPDRIVVFGDSLSDSGNGFVFAKTSSTPPDWGMDFLLIPDAPYARGGHHLSNGPTWIEQFARPLGFAPYVQPAFRSSSPDALNFAIGTARAREGTADPSLALQVASFLQKTGGVAPSDALYVIQIGANDVRDALAAGSVTILQQAAAAIAANVQTLYAAGARHFLIWNVPDVGLTPTVRFLDQAMPGTAAAATLASTALNALLQGAMAPLSSLPGISIVPFDAFGLISAIAGHPSQFALTNVTDACVTPNEPPFACTNPDDYLFWDGIHPTAAAHEIIARAVAMLFGL